MTARLVLAVNDAVVSDQAAALAREGDELEVVELVDDLDRVVRTLQRTDADVVVLHDVRGAVSVLELTAELSATFPEVGVVVVLAESSADVMRSAMQAGARDVVALPLSLEDVQLSVRAAAAWARTMRGRVTGESEAATATVNNGRVVAVAGAKGGTGVTTLALHLALGAAAAEPERRVCLVDLDLQAGDFRSFLDLPYRRSITDLIEVSEELSVRHLDETLYGHHSGVRVLLAPEEGEHAEDVTGIVARNVLGALRARHDLVVVDLGATVSEAGAAVCELADDVLVIATPDVVALRGAQRLVKLWERLHVAGPRPRVVLNRTSRRREVQPELARQVVGESLCATTVPADFAALEAAVNTGMPERLEERKLRSAITSLAAEIDLFGTPADEEPEPELDGGGGGLVARLQGESGQSTAETMGLLPVIAIVVLALVQMGLIGYTFMISGHAAREGARGVAVGDSAAPLIREDVPASWRDGLKCALGDTRVRVSLAVPSVLPGLDTPIRISSSAGITDETAPVGPIERSLKEPRKREDDACRPEPDKKSDEDKKKDEDKKQDEDSSDSTGSQGL